MLGQMCWLPKLGTDEENILHLRTAPHEPWRPYTACAEAVPDYDVPRGSKGWATYQTLLRQGWKLVPTGEAKMSASFSAGAFGVYSSS